ncbi:hypothetical protein Hsar01_03768 [Haloferula sargassicola]|uniref:HTH luxR-type domain-containing protein n=2 Tax=Haloferula sargassicola TaxID=490096 RepID=A0ABP9UT42_9BACT
MVRLLANTVAIPGGHEEKKRFLMAGICDLVRADSWVWTLGCGFREGGGQTCVNFLHHGFDDDRFARYLEGLEDREASAVAWPFYEALMAGEENRLLTMTRREIDPDDRSSAGRVGELWQRADIGPIVLSGRVLDEQSLSLIAVYRRVGDAPFELREKTIAHIMLSEVRWLHEIGWPVDRGAEVPHLAPRQRMVLNLLLDGMDRKRIAAHLDLSLNTVHGYIRDLYRTLGVNSHAVLMKRFGFSKLSDS